MRVEHGGSSVIPPLIEHIHVARAAGARMESLESVYARPGIGLEGDRYARGLGHFSNDRRVSRDITLVEGEAIDQLRIEFGIVLEPGASRRNVTTRGVDVNGLVGRRFFLGDVLCLGTKLCNPCQYLADLLARPVVRPLLGRGGLRADLLTQGRIGVGDPIQVAPTSRLVIGTTNSEKARQFVRALAGLDLDLRPISEVVSELPEAAEQSRDPLENARVKARAYAKHVDLPVLAIDFALLFDGIDDELQPGAMVRRLRGSELNFDDDQVVQYYSALIARHGGQLQGHWRAAFALVTDEATNELEVTVTRTFVASPSPTRKSGYPLASLQLATDLVYVSELDDEVMAYPELGPPLRRFVAAALSER